MVTITLFWIITPNTGDYVKQRIFRLQVARIPGTNYALGKILPGMTWLDVDNMNDAELQAHSQANQDKEMVKYIIPNSLNDMCEGHFFLFQLNLAFMMS